MLSKSQKKRVVSSAYIISPQMSVKLGESFIHIENSKDPRTDPCGIPDFTINGFDRILSSSTICFLFVK